MPQLNPNPWLFILLTSWIILLLMFKTKTLVTNPTNLPTPTDTMKQQTTPWHWPWI